MHAARCPPPVVSNQVAGKTRLKSSNRRFWMLYYAYCSTLYVRSPEPFHEVASGGAGRKRVEVLSVGLGFLCQSKPARGRASLAQWPVLDDGLLGSCTE
jgi:hypothetical protein